MEAPRSKLADFPHRVFLLAILWRSAVVWAGVRAAASLAGGVDLALYASAAVVVLVAWLTYRDAHRRNEVLFLANLGVRGRIVAGLATVVPAVLEGAVRLAV